MKQPKRDYCGCCGADIGPESGNISEPWCSHCRKHVGKIGAPWERTFLAINKLDCPFQIGGLGVLEQSLA